MKAILGPDCPGPDCQGPICLDLFLLGFGGHEKNGIQGGGLTPGGWQISSDAACDVLQLVD